MCPLDWWRDCRFSLSTPWAVYALFPAADADLPVQLGWLWQPRRRHQGKTHHLSHGRLLRGTVSPSPKVWDGRTPEGHAQLRLMLMSVCSGSDTSVRASVSPRLFLISWRSKVERPDAVTHWERWCQGLLPAAAWLGASPGESCSSGGLQNNLGVWSSPKRKISSNFGLMM